MPEQDGSYLPSLGYGESCGEGQFDSCSEFWGAIGAKEHGVYEGHAREIYQNLETGAYSGGGIFPTAKVCKLYLNTAHLLEKQWIFPVVMSS